jgi:hypothetical protein
MSHLFHADFVDCLLAELSSERTWSARLLAEQSGDEGDENSGPAVAATTAVDDSAAGAATAVVILHVDQPAAAGGSGRSSGGSVVVVGGGGGSSSSSSAGAASTPPLVRISCVTREQRSGRSEQCNLWEARLDAEALQAHRASLGIQSSMTAAKFFSLFWSAMHRAVLERAATDSGGSDDDTEHGGGDGGVLLTGSTRALLLEYQIVEGVVLSGRLAMAHACAVPTQLFPLMWKLQAARPGSAIVQRQHQPAAGRDARAGSSSSSSSSSGSRTANQSQSATQSTTSQSSQYSQSQSLSQSDLGTPSKRKAGSISSPWRRCVAAWRLHRQWLLLCYDYKRWRPLLPWLLSTPLSVNSRYANGWVCCRCAMALLADSSTASPVGGYLNAATAASAAAADAAGGDGNGGGAAGGGGGGAAAAAKPAGPAKGKAKRRKLKVGGAKFITD